MRCLFAGGEHQLGPRQDRAFLPIASGEKSNCFNDGRRPPGLVSLSCPKTDGQAAQSPRQKWSEPSGLKVGTIGF
jgi:hypothetical protein